MASIIRIKRSEVTGNPSTLAAGELAYSALTGNHSNGGDRLYIGMGTETAGDAANHVVIGGKYFTDMLDHTHGTLTASSAIITDTNNKIDALNVDNVTINGNTISTTDTNGNLVLAPDGTGLISANSTKIINLATPVDDTDAATKGYVDTVSEATTIGVKDSSGTSYEINLQDSALSLKGDGYAISVDYRAADKSFVTTLNNSGVTGGSYGSQTAIPVLTIDDTGRVTSATTANVASSLTINGDGPTSDTVSLLDSSLSFSGGTAVTATVTDNTVTISVQDASTSAKGIASYSSADFAVNSGVVDLADEVLKAITTDTGAITMASHSISILGGEGVDVTHIGTQITVAGELATTSNIGVASFEDSDFDITSGHVRIKEGGVSNVQLANSTITLGSSTLTLGATTTDVAGLTSLVVDNITIDGNTIKSTDGSNTLYIDPAPVDSDGGDLVIRGNLIVQGTTTTVNSTTVSINDLNIVLADSAADANEADGAGLTIGGAGYSGTKATLTYNGANDEWEMNKTLNLSDSNSLEFGGINWKEVLEDHLANNYFLQGEGIDLTYDDNANTLTVSAELATVSNPGVANFDSDQFTVTSGLVSIYNLDGGTY